MMYHVHIYYCPIRTVLLDVSTVVSLHIVLRNIPDFVKYYLVLRTTARNRNKIV
jgi:hypothetical protein